MAEALTADILREELGVNSYRLLTQNDKDAATKAIRKAKIFINSIYRRAGKETEYDETDDNIFEAILFRTQFELFVKLKKYDFATKARNESQAIMINLLGSVADIFTDDNQVGVTAKKTVTKHVLGRTEWNGYK